MTGLVDPQQFFAASGTVFAIAIIAAIARTAIRFQHFGRLFIDDAILFFGVATLISGTALLFINVPYAYDQEQVEAGAKAPPPNFLTSLVQDEKTQYAATVLIGTTIMAVKFSFLFFFRMLIKRAKAWYTTWWWIVTAITLASAPIIMFSDFIACPYTGAAILTKCVSAAAMARQNATIKGSIAVDIVTDVLIISIPVIILWQLQVSLRKKYVLASSLCLSVFMIICAGVRLGAAHIAGGQSDTLWLLLWEELEACVAIIVVSMTAFKMLFTSGNQTAAKLPGSPTRRGQYDSTWSADSRRGRWGYARNLLSSKRSKDTVHGQDSEMSFNEMEMRDSQDAHLAFPDPVMRV